MLNKWLPSCLLHRVRLFATPWTIIRQGALPWDFPGKSTGVDCHILFQGVFLTQGLNLSLLHCQLDTLLPSQLGSL